MPRDETVNRQKAWGGKIAAYLFLAGAGAGAYLAAFFLALIRPELTIAINTGLALSLSLMVLGILFLILDLGKKLLAFLAFSRPRESWISRGTIIITAFLIFDIAYFVIITRAGGMEDTAGWGLVWGILAAIFALLTLTYTGMVLGAARPVVFWDPGFLTVLFLVSGISSGIAGMVFCLSIYNLSSDMALASSLLFLMHYNAFVLTAEVIVIGLYLFRMYRRVQPRPSVRLILKGNLAVPFWGVVVVGLLVSLVFDYCLAYLSVPVSVPISAVAVAVSLAGLSSGFTLRYIAVAAGISLPLNIEGRLISIPQITRGEFYLKD